MRVVVAEERRYLSKHWQNAAGVSLLFDGQSPFCNMPGPRKYSPIRTLESYEGSLPPKLSLNFYYAVCSCGF